MFVCFERNAAAAQLLSWQQRGASLIPFRHIERSKDVARDLHPGFDRRFAQLLHDCYFAMNTSAIALTIDRVGKTYPLQKTTLKVLDRISLQVSQGEFVSIVGASG